MRKYFVILVVILLTFEFLATRSTISLAQKKYNEAPMLSELVKQGKLPSVEKRLPDEPLVVTPVESVGEYGGTMRRAYFGMGDLTGWYRLVNEMLIGWTRDYKKLRPNIAKSWKVSNNGRVFTFYLRKGMKWSDGEPFTADDIIFWYEDIILNKELASSPPSWLVYKGKVPKVEKIDDYTVRFTYEEPYGFFLSQVAEFGGMYTASPGGTYAPKHYLKQFHPKYTSKETLDELVKKENYTHWTQLFNAKSDWRANPDCPVIMAWKITQKPGAQFIATRNPYYWKVDTAGNQLPYIDRVIQDLVESTEVMVMKALNGEIDFQIRHFHNRWADYPLLMENRDKGKYRVLQWISSYSGGAVAYFNLETKNPVLKKLFQDKRFRIALSLAINRNEINELVFRGVGNPQQPYGVPGSDYYVPEIAQRYAQYNPKEANRLLDQMGLTKRDKDGYRLGPDGKPVTITIEVRTGVSQEQIDTAELFVKYWKDVGIKAAVKAEERSLFETRKTAGEFEVMMQDATCDPYALFSMHWFVPITTSCVYGPLYGLWYVTKGASGIEPPSEVKKLLELYERAVGTAVDSERKAIVKSIFDILSRNVYMIGTVSLPRNICIAKENLRNVPEVGFFTMSWPLSANPEQFFFKSQK